MALKRKSLPGHHKKKLRRQHLDALAPARDLDACPKPWKYVYISRSEGHTAAKAQRNLGRRQWCYPCACGRWHLTSRIVVPPCESGTE